MIEILIGIALKSLLVTGFTLGLLALLKQRSAAERSWVAHIGLLTLIVVALAPVALPRWSVETPALISPAVPELAAGSAAKIPITIAAQEAVTAAPARSVRIAPAAIAAVAYALPATLLLLVTLLALLRLVALRARAEVLVDGHWLSALAHAQRRMGFKYGTALLTSNDLSSPISWGLVRPVILLNARAAEASSEAEAIIAHELAHVARMDWIKLLLARIATALFWFNPLAWMLAREAHQLREEAADDLVLAADIPDTDYAQLLVGVARHECSGLLLGAHGVAPSRSSLARRVARVLDGESVRGPVTRSFAWVVLVGAILVAAPLAALTISPAGSSSNTPGQTNTFSSGSVASKTRTLPNYDALSGEPATDVASIIADGVTTAVAAVAPLNRGILREERQAAPAEALESAAEARRAGIAAVGAARAAVRVGHDRTDHLVDRIVEMHAVGVTADYVNAMRAAAPQLRSLHPDSFTAMKAVGVTPDYARGLAAVGFRKLGEDDLTSARAVGLGVDYARALANAGLLPRIDDYIQLWTVGVPARFIATQRSADHRAPNADRIVEMWVLGVRPENIDSSPTSPRPPDRDTESGG